MEIGPMSLPIASTSASIAPSPLTSSTRPWPPCAASRAPIAFAPPSDVAVPTTVAPCAASRSAIAAPIPRLAPVTSATSPCNTFSMTAPSAVPFRHRRVQFGGGADGAGVEGLVDAAGQAGQHLARAAFGDAGGATRCQCLHATGPLNRQVELAHQRVADGLGA